MMSIARGCALLFTEGRPVSGFERLPEPRHRAHPRHSGAGGDHRCRLPGCALRAVTRTRFGRYVYAIGGNEEATRLSGVNVRLPQDDGVWRLRARRARSPPCCSPRGSTRRSRSPGSCTSSTRSPRRSSAAPACSGGEGGVGGTLIGALIMGVLRNGLNLLGRVVVPAAGRHRAGDRVCSAAGHGAEVDRRRESRDELRLQSSQLDGEIDSRGSS